MHIGLFNGDKLRGNAVLFWKIRAGLFEPFLPFILPGFINFDSISIF